MSLLSEYDALPGIGHACGHNIIATAGLGAALGLSKLGSKLTGRVRYMGTPAEERGGGKEVMAQAGAFDGVDASMMVHPAGFDMVTMPCIALAEVEVVYHGRAAHASAMAFRGLNALDALVTAYQTIAQLRQHIQQTERIHGIIVDGGMAPNIVPERAAGPLLRPRPRRRRTRGPEEARPSLLRSRRARHRHAARNQVGPRRLPRPQNQLAARPRL